MYIVQLVSFYPCFSKEAKKHRRVSQICEFCKVALLSFAKSWPTFAENVYCKAKVLRHFKVDPVLKIGSSSHCSLVCPLCCPCQ